MSSKRMILLYPEEKRLPTLRRVSLRAYRIYMLVLVPGSCVMLPVFIILKAIGAISCSWWWVLPVLIISAPLLVLFVWIAVVGSLRVGEEDEHQNKTLQTCMGIYKHDATGQYYIIEKTCDGKIIGGFGPSKPDYMMEDMLKDETMRHELDELLVKHSGTPHNLNNWLKSGSFTLCYEKRPSTKG